MSTGEDLRSRIEARVAERRAGQPRHARVRATEAPVPAAETLVPPTEAVTQQLPRVDPQAAAPKAEAEARRTTSRHATRRPRTDRGFGLRLVVMVVLAAMATFALRTWVVEPFWIPSQSMEPTLHGCPGCNDDRLLVNKLAYRLHGVHRGDVVVFGRPPNFPTPERDLIKRVVALPGETVSGHDGRVWIGDRPLAEPYVAAACHGTASFAPVTVPSGQVFVMGDNRCDSSDSRVFGPIRTSAIVGRAFVVFWPLPRIHWL